jgi:hypothetical protein
MLSSIPMHFRHNIMDETVYWNPGKQVFDPRLSPGGLFNYRSMQ